MHAAHIFSRGNPHVRHDLDNGIALCFYHHRFFAHSSPVEFVDFIKEWMGIEKFEALKKRALQSDGKIGVQKNGI